MKHIPLKAIGLKSHPVCTEKWLQDTIAQDPSILGLGDLILKDRERVQSRAGRLDLLLQEPEEFSRYEVEIQLGSTDESHIIRTLEYWDIERKRYPQYEHTAVIIAEDVTSRFSNVISLFNGYIPVMALQLAAFEMDDGIALHFTRVLDTVQLGYVDEDEESTTITDRGYWENKATKKTVALADQILDVIQEFAPNVEHSFNKRYIGCKVNGSAMNFALCQPLKSGMNISITIPKTDALDTKLEESDLTLLDYSKKRGSYRFKVHQQDVKNHRDLLKELLIEAHKLRS